MQSQVAPPVGLVAVGLSGQGWVKVMQGRRNVDSASGRELSSKPTLAKREVKVLQSMATMLPVTDALTFTDLVDFLSDREGQKVYVEIGARDHEARERDTDEFMAVIHGHRLRVIQDATDPDVGGERKAVMVRLHPLDAPALPPDYEKKEVTTRLFFNPRRITKIKGDPIRAIKVWRDDGVYIGIS
jgi:hypothetical protein